MESDELSRFLREGLIEELMLGAIVRAYEVRSGDGHRIELGDNPMTFGMNIRFSIERFIEEALQSRSDITISRPLGSFQMRRHGYSFHFYKFGMHASDDVDNMRLDSSETKINIVAENQLVLPGIVDLKQLIVAHSGNPDDGLVSVYVGAPKGLGTDGSPWAWRHPIYTQDTQDPSNRRFETNMIPSFLDQPEPAVLIRRKTTVEQESGTNPRL